MIVRRLVILVAGLLLAVGAGVAAASALVPSAPKEPPPAEVAAARPGSERVEAQAPDPDGGPAWGVRSYTGATGASCVSVGRVEAGTFGTLINGRIKPLDVDQSGSCGDLSGDGVQLFLGHFAATADTGERSVVYGRATPGTHSVTYVDTSRRTELAIADDGGFLLVARGLIGEEAFRLHVVDASGSSSDRGF